MPEEQTRAQTLLIAVPELSNPLPKTFETYRAIRRHPTVALARAIRTAAVVAANWSIEADDEVEDDLLKFIRDQIMSLRETFIERAMLGGIDFGFQPFEVVFEAVDGMVHLKKLKPLLHEITTIRVDANGKFMGFVQDDVITGVEVILPVENSLNIYLETPEGTNWYGSSLLENIRPTYNEWVEANAGAAKYDKKLAGSHWVIHYPAGSSIIDGTNIDNFEVAKGLLQNLSSSGQVAIPRTPTRFNDAGDEMPGWEIELKGDASAKQASFVPRLQYLDVQFVRGLLLPERSILEGQFGTKAEAGEHADLAITHMDIVHRNITRLFNWHVVNRLLVVNFGREVENTVRLVAAPLSDDKLAYLRTVYTKILSNAGGFAEEFGLIDTDAMKDTLEIPKSEEIADVDPLIEEVPEQPGMKDVIRGIFEEDDVVVEEDDEE